MNKTGASLTVALVDSAVCIKIAGRADHCCSADFKNLAEEFVRRGITRFILELSECSHMDSSFLGALVWISPKFPRKDAGARPSYVELANAGAHLTGLLSNLGVGNLFPVSENPALKTALFQPVAVPKSSRTDIVRNSLEAHQTLMEAHPDNVGKFKDVAQFLADDLKRLEGR